MLVTAVRDRPAGQPVGRINGAPLRRSSTGVVYEPDEPDNAQLAGRDSGDAPPIGFSAAAAVTVPTAVGSVARRFRRELSP